MRHRPESPVVEADARRDTHEFARKIVTQYAQAKSRQDADAALRLCTPGFLLHTEPLQSTAAGLSNVNRLMKKFFRIFPDYTASLEGDASNDYGYMCWGTATMTMRGSMGWWRATNRTARLPFYCLFKIEGERLSSEGFYFSQTEFCTQLGLPASPFRRMLTMGSKLPLGLQLLLL